MSHPKILLLDIETSPDLVWTWRLYDSNAIAVKEHWRIISFSAEWYHSKKKVTLGLDDFGGYKGDDEGLCDRLWELMDEADIVVAHNGQKFDIRKINARFIAWGFDPPAPYKVVDTKKEASRVAAFSSNRLDWLCKQLDLGKKLEHEGFDLWIGCMNDVKKCWTKMKRYNRHDIVLLRELYERLSPWSRQPNANFWNKNEMVCVSPTCGSTHLIKKGVVHLKTRSYQRYRCQECGKPARSVFSEKNCTGITEVS
jgi:hypothetical protein